jgi:hypothetical protein
VIARAMQKNPQARYQDAAEMARDLAQCRITLARTKGAAAPAAKAAPDPYAATAPIGSDTVPLPRFGDGEGLAPSAMFDSAAGLQRLLADRSGPVPPPVRPPASVRRLAWAIAYAATAAVAVAIAMA